MSAALTVPRRSKFVPILVALSWLLAVGLFIALIVERSRGNDLTNEPSSLTTWTVRGSALFAIVFWIGLTLYGGRSRRRSACMVWR